MPYTHGVFMFDEADCLGDRHGGLGLLCLWCRRHPGLLRCNRILSMLHCNRVESVIVWLPWWRCALFRKLTHVLECTLTLLQSWQEGVLLLQSTSNCRRRLPRSTQQRREYAVFITLVQAVVWRICHRLAHWYDRVVLLLYYLWLALLGTK